MTSKAQVPQIPAKKPLLNANPLQVAAGGSTTAAAAAAAATTISNAQSQLCIMQPSAANQSLLKANPVGGASDAVSNIRSQVEAEGKFVGSGLPILAPKIAFRVCFICSF